MLIVSSIRERTEQGRDIFGFFPGVGDSFMVTKCKRNVKVGDQWQWNRKDTRTGCRVSDKSAICLIKVL